VQDVIEQLVGGAGGDVQAGGSLWSKVITGPRESALRSILAGFARWLHFFFACFAKFSNKRTSGPKSNASRAARAMERPFLAAIRIAAMTHPAVQQIANSLIAASWGCT